MSYEIFSGKALKKLDEKVKSSSSKINVMKDPVCEALKSFCRQSEEFAQAVVQGGSFEECMKAVEKGAGSALSDLDAYKKAVKFYFPTATISFSMTINTEGNNDLSEASSGTSAEKSEEKSSVNMSLDDLLGL